MTQLDARPPTDPDDPRPARRTTPRTGSRPGSGGWFRAVWRWHFFASFLVVPVLLLLATTGLIYLFRFQLEPLLHPDLMKVDPPAGDGRRSPTCSQLAVVEGAYPGATPVSMAEPRDAEQPDGRLDRDAPTATVRDVYVNPYGPEVLGSLEPGHDAVRLRAIRLHGELMAGRWGDYVIELGACWALVMALTGYYLFVRGLAGPAPGAQGRRPGASCARGTAWSARSPASGCSPCW